MQKPKTQTPIAHHTTRVPMPSYFAVLLLLLGIFVSTLANSIPVTCGSIIKLKHSTTGAYLHSHDIRYGTGSGQQSVTAVPQDADSNSYWQIKAGFNQMDCEPGTPLRHNDIIRLVHVNTGKYLHSHSSHRSPLTQQQEVTCLEPLNTGDDWQILLNSGQNEWQKGLKLRLLHTDTKMYLHSHHHKYGKPIHGQQEVTGFQRYGDKSNIWTAEFGIYLESHMNQEE